MDWLNALKFVLNELCNIELILALDEIEFDWTLSWSSPQKLMLPHICVIIVVLIFVHWGYMHLLHFSCSLTLPLFWWINGNSTSTLTLSVLRIKLHLPGASDVYMDPKLNCDVQLMHTQWGTDQVCRQSMVAGAPALKPGILQVFLTIFTYWQICPIHWWDVEIQMGTTHEINCLKLFSCGHIGSQSIHGKLKSF